MTKNWLQKRSTAFRFAAHGLDRANASTCVQTKGTMLGASEPRPSAADTLFTFRRRAKMPNGHIVDTHERAGGSSSALTRGQTAPADCWSAGKRKPPIISVFCIFSLHSPRGVPPEFSDRL
jgi:hypothetical protein